MITGVQDVFYNVSDMAKAVAFFRDTLDMSVVYEDTHWTSLRCGSVQIGLHWTSGPAVPRIARDAHGAEAGATLTLASTDVAADRRRLEQAGGKILGEADEHWGHMLVFEDLDGNVLKLMKPK